MSVHLLLLHPTAGPDIASETSAYNCEVLRQDKQPHWPLVGDGAQILGVPECQVDANTNAQEGKNEADKAEAGDKAPHTFITILRHDVRRLVGRKLCDLHGFSIVVHSTTSYVCQPRQVLPSFALTLDSGYTHNPANMEYHVNIMKPIDAREVYSLSEFQRNAKKMIAHVKETRRPLLLTVNGSAEVVVVDAEEYQEVIEERERAEFIESLKKGLAEADAGLGTPAEEVFAELEAKYGL